MSALSSLLVQDQILSVNQVEQALQRQVIFGGDLATNLLEFGLVQEDVLIEYVGRVMRQPVLPREALESIDPDLAGRLPWRLADERRVIPVRFRDDSLILACAAPPPAEAVEEISTALGVDVVFHLVLEFRLAIALNRCFGIRIPARLSGLQKRYAPGYVPDPIPLIPPPADRGMVRTPEPPPAPAAEEPVVIESSATAGRPGDSTIRFITGSNDRESTAPFGHRTARIPAAPHPAEPANAKPRRLSFSKAIAELGTAQSRDEILRLFFDFSRQAFDFTALFLVHGGLAQGRVAGSRGGPAVDIEHVTVPLEGGGMFQTVHETRGFHLGPPGDAPPDNELLAQLRRPRLSNCAVIPVSLRQRIVLLLYGDSANRGVRASRVAKLADFGREVAGAFERILLAQKLGGYRRPSDVRRAKPGPAERAPAPAPPAVGAGLLGYQAKEPPRTPSLVPVGKARLRPATPPATEHAAALGTDSWPAPGGPPPHPPETRSVEPAGQDDFAIRATEPAIENPPAAPVRKAFDPARPPASGLISRADVIEVSPDYRTSEQDEPFRTPDTPPAPGQSPAPPERRPETETRPAVTVQRVVSVGTPSAVAPVTPVAPVAPVRSVVVEMGEDIDRLIERVLSRGGFAAHGAPDEEAATLLLGIGDDALIRLVRQFPGPLFHDRYRDPNRVRPVKEFGPLLALLARFGERAVPYLLPLTDGYDSEVRYFATYLFTAIPHPLVLPALVKRVFDNDRQIRALAIDVIGGFERFPEYRWAVQDLAAALTSSSSNLERKRLAAEALGRLQAPFAVKALAEMLGSVDGVLAEICQRALVRTTFNDFGFSERRWLTWWQGNRGRHRIEWALESVNHRREEIRLHAIAELRRLAGDSISWPAGPLDHKQRKELRRLVEEWWGREGRTLHPPPDCW
jgi:hypothetical protein